jgi:hypothetical protein
MSSVYEAAIERLQPHIKRAEDGTFSIAVTCGADVGIDEDVFTDLRHSVEMTNRMIRNDELDPTQVSTLPKVPWWAWRYWLFVSLCWLSHAWCSITGQPRS